MHSCRTSVHWSWDYVDQGASWRGFVDALSGASHCINPNRLTPSSLRSKANIFSRMLPNLTLSSFQRQQKGWLFLSVSLSPHLSGVAEVLIRLKRLEACPHFETVWKIFSFFKLVPEKNDLTNVNKNCVSPFSYVRKNSLQLFPANVLAWNFPSFFCLNFNDQQHWRGLNRERSLSLWSEG